MTGTKKLTRVSPDMVYLSREKEHLRCLAALHHHLWQQMHTNVLQSRVMYYSGNVLCYTITDHEGETCNRISWSGIHKPQNNKMPAYL
jgi:hypothetical protein